MVKILLDQGGDYSNSDREKSPCSVLANVLDFDLEISEGCPRGVMVKAMDCGIVVREFVLQSRYYVHFRANTLGKAILPAMG